MSKLNAFTKLRPVSTERVSVEKLKPGHVIGSDGKQYRVHGRPFNQNPSIAPSRTLEEIVTNCIRFRPHS